MRLRYVYWDKLCELFGFLRLVAIALGALALLWSWLMETLDKRKKLW